MSHPQHNLRVYLDGGPRSGETVSVTPDGEGSPPDRIVVDENGDLDPTAEETQRAAESDSPTTAYELSHSDMDNDLWVYRPAGGNARPA
jgi:hypothetical protein